MRLRCQGERIITADAAKPFRHTDLSPREELAEYRGELAGLEAWRVANTFWKTWPGSDDPKMRRIEELKKKIATLDYWFNDAATPVRVRTLAELNKTNAAFWESRR